jgi:hypothetical protein
VSKLADQIRTALLAAAAPPPRPPVLNTIANVVVVAWLTRGMSREGWPWAGIISLVLTASLVFASDVMRWRRWYAARKGTP